VKNNKQTKPLEAKVGSRAISDLRPKAIRSPAKALSSKTSGTNRRPEAIDAKTSAEAFEAKLLESFTSLADFADLLDVTGMIPTPQVMDPSAGRMGPKPGPEEILLALEKSRFRFLVESLPSATENPYRRLVADSVRDFLTPAHFLFIQAADLRRKVQVRQDKRGHERRAQTPEAGQELLTEFTTTGRPRYRVSDKGRLVLQRLVSGRDPAPFLINRFIDLLNGSDPSRIRQCAFVDCRRVFYARRSDQLCCTESCNNKRLQREWYQRQGKAAVYKRANRKEQRR
jgi:hypothetical protein